MGRDGGKLRRVGAIWKPREGAKSKGSGEVSIRGYLQRFVILTNTYKQPGSKQPDYVLMSSDPPERDERSEGESHPDATNDSDENF